MGEVKLLFATLEVEIGLGLFLLCYILYLISTYNKKAACCFFIVNVV